MVSLTAAISNTVSRAGIGDGGRHVRRRIDEYPFVAGVPGRLDEIGDPVDSGAQRRLAAAPQLVPQGQRALRIAIDQQDRAGRSVRLGGKMRGQRALARAAFA
jgi:hypothetical protein